MDRSDVSVAATMGVGTVQAFTTFVGSIATSDMMDDESYWRGIGMSLGWSFVISIGFSVWVDSPAPLAAWLLTSAGMLGAYEYQRDRSSSGN